MAISDELRAQILRYHFVEHWRVGTIASQLRVHHYTVERVLGEASVEREPRNRTGEHRWTTDAETGALIGELARMLPDELIAGLLNRLGRKTGKGNNWTKSRVCSFRCARRIGVYREGERQERGELILSEAAEQLGVGRVVVRRLIRSGALPAHQACKGAPWIIDKEALELPEVLAGLSKCGPLTAHPNQTNLDFQ